MRSTKNVKKCLSQKNLPNGTGRNRSLITYFSHLGSRLGDTNWVPQPWKQTFLPQCHLVASGLRGYDDHTYGEKWSICTLTTLVRLRKEIDEIQRNMLKGFRGIFEAT